MRIVVEVGHSTKDPGAIGVANIREAEIVREVALRLQAISPVYECKRRPPIPGGLGILLACLRLNKPDIVISLHCDAGPPDRDCGGAYYAYTSMPSRRLAELIVEQMRALSNPAARLHSAPYARSYKGKVTDYTPGILRGTAKEAAVLIELGNMKYEPTAFAMVGERWQTRSATAIDNAVREYIAEG